MSVVGSAVWASSKAAPPQSTPPAPKGPGTAKQQQQKLSPTVDQPKTNVPITRENPRALHMLAQCRQKANSKNPSVLAHMQSAGFAASKVPSGNACQLLFLSTFGRYLNIVFRE
jgi:hypothetical protein